MKKSNVVLIVIITLVICIGFCTGFLTCKLIKTKKINNEHSAYTMSDETSTTVVQTTESEPVTNEHIVETTYNNALNATKADLTGSEGHWKYDGIPLLTKDCKWIDNPINKEGTVNQGAVYRKFALVLEGSDFEKKQFLYNYRDVSIHLLGFVPKDKDEWVKYAKNASDFIVTDNQMTAIMKKFQSMKSVNGSYDFNYKDFGKFSVDIPDLTKCAEEMQISEKMLGYVLAMLDEYASTITFNGNSCHIEYSSY